MANKVLWLPESVVTPLTTELNNLAAAAFCVDAASYANQTNKFRYADFLLHIIDFDAAPAAGGYFELHIFYRTDGTIYGDGNDGDGDADSVLSAATLQGVFPVAAADVTQYIPLIGVPLSPFEFKAVINNVTSQGLTAVDTNWLKMVPYNEEIQ